MRAPQTIKDQEGSSDPVLVDLLRQSALSQGIAVGELSRSYLDALTRLPIDDLKREPLLVANETSTVETELINLCFREYPTFISVHKCSAAVQAAFDDFDTSLKALVDSVPTLEEECRAFARRTSATQASRSKAALVQEHQDKLLDVVEIPRLMETSVRNGYYQEAMELAAHARNLAERYPGVLLIADMLAEVENVAQIMLAQLVNSLREPVKLPTLIKAVGYLRRLGSMEEDELGVIFLISRLHNFQTAVQQIERERHDAVRYLRRYIDLFREHVYDIISQFSSIFTDPTLLASFSQRCIDDLVHLIREQVPRMGADAASLSSILVQLGYCAASFSRVGLDFTSLVTAPFRKTIVETFSARAKKATADVIAILQSPTAADDPTTLTSHVYSADGASGDAQLDIASFPPLAEYVNEYLTTLNTLRLLAPYDARKELVSVLGSSISTVSSALYAYAERAAATSEQPRKAIPGSPPAWRRQSDAFLSTEARAAKREQAERITVDLLSAFRRAAVPLLCESLETGVYGQENSAGRRLPSAVCYSSSLKKLDVWLQSHQKIPEATHVSTDRDDTQNVTPDRPESPIPDTREEDTPQNGPVSAQVGDPEASQVAQNDPELPARSATNAGQEEHLADGPTPTTAAEPQIQSEAVEPSSPASANKGLGGPTDPASLPEKATKAEDGEGSDGITTKPSMTSDGASAEADAVPSSSQDTGPVANKGVQDVQLSTAAAAAETDADDKPAQENQPALSENPSLAVNKPDEIQDETAQTNSTENPAQNDDTADTTDPVFDASQPGSSEALGRADLPANGTPADSANVLAGGPHEGVEPQAEQDNEPSASGLITRSELATVTPQSEPVDEVDAQPADEAEVDGENAGNTGTASRKKKKKKKGKK